MVKQDLAVNMWAARKNRKGHKKMSIEPSLPIIQKILDPNYQLHFKIFWISAIISCFGLCFYQVGFRIQNYIDEPIAIKLEMTRLTSVTFPSIVICSDGLTSVMRNIYAEYQQCKSNMSTCNDHVQMTLKQFKQLNTTMEKKIENYSQINQTDLLFSNHCPLFADESDDCSGVSVNTHMSLQTLDTIWGHCLVLTLKDPMDYRGPFTWISISWNNSMFSYSDPNYPESDEYYFFLQANKSALSRHEAIYVTETLDVGFETNVRISARQFKFLNTRKRQCTDDLSAVRCFESCVDNLLSKNLSCRIPIMKSGKLPPCATMKDAIQAFADSDQVYAALNSTSCSCTRRCNKTVYKISVDSQVELDDNQTKLRILYSDDTLEVLTEEEIFSFSELVSEIGGTIGLYLGICFFTVFEMIETIAKRFTKCR